MVQNRSTHLNQGFRVRTSPPRYIICLIRNLHYACSDLLPVVQTSSCVGGCLRKLIIEADRLYWLASPTYSFPRALTQVTVHVSAQFMFPRAYDPQYTFIVVVSLATRSGRSRYIVVEIFSIGRGGSASFAKLDSSESSVTSE